MKKLFSIAAVLCLALALLVTASAETTNANAANGLYALGLIQGYSEGGSDFGLDDNLTRAQAVVLLERYLGVFETAKSENAKAPFDDVPEWAAPYVGYATANGLVSGKKDALGRVYFDPDAAISEPEFLTLLLRAMDYADKNDGSGDFIWSDPFTLAGKLGLVTNTAARADFKRGDAFLVCWNALGAKSKTGKGIANRLTEQHVFKEEQYTMAKRIAAGEKITVACVGDSITQGTGAKNSANYYPSQLQKLLGDGFKVVNCGKASAYVMSPESEYNVKASTPELWYKNTAQYKTAMASNPDIIIVMLGTNDARSMSEGAAKDDFVKWYKDLISDFQSLESKPQIYLSTMIPAVNGHTTYQGTSWILPDVIREIADELKLPLVDTAENVGDYYTGLLAYGDKVHPTDKTYRALAVSFYNEVFGGKLELPTVKQAENGVVFVSESGSMDNGGTSPSDAVQTLTHAAAMLAENGGTIVVCGTTAETIVVMPETKGRITITSTYGGVDYAKTKGAKLELGGTFMFGGDCMIENVDIVYKTSGNGFYCGYHNVTFGDGVTCTRADGISADWSVNAGYAIGIGGVTREDVSCHEDCTITVNSGTFSIFRGGNIRSNAAYPVGSVDKGVKLNCIIGGGTFTYVGANVTTGTGMNGCDGDLYFEINGGEFAMPVFGVCRIGSNTTGYTPTFGGSLTVKITGGIFKGEVGLYQSADSPRVKGGSTLILGGSAKDELQGTIRGFDRYETVD